MFFLLPYPYRPAGSLKIVTINYITRGLSLPGASSINNILMSERTKKIAFHLNSKELLIMFEGVAV